jgi:hypothetical protein
MLRTPTATHSNVAAATANTQLLAANPHRLGCSVFNDSTAALYLKCDTGASATSCTVKVPAGMYWEMPPEWRYTGAIYGYWDSVNGAARVTSVDMAEEA